MQQDQGQATPPLDPVTAASLLPINELSAENLRLLISKGKLAAVPGGQTLNADDEYRWLVYLLDGVVALREGKLPQVSAQSERARRPLFNERAAHQQAVTKTTCRLLRLDRQLFETLRKEEDLRGESSSDIQINATESAIFEQIFKAYSQKTLKLPSLPEVALKIRDAVNSPKVGIPEICRLIEADPALAADLIRVANSPISRGSGRVDSLEEAVMRLGLDTTRYMAISHALKELFHAHSPRLKQRMQTLYAHSAHVAALSYTLAKRCKHFRPGRALLAGLVHDIGIIPVLTYADTCLPELPEDAILDAAIGKLRGVVGGLVLGHWQFDPDFVQVAEESEDWHRDPAPQPDYCDLVLVAQWHSYIGKPGMAHCPDITTIPAFRKLGLGEPSPEVSAQIMDQAKEEVDAIRRLLQGGA